MAGNVRYPSLYQINTRVWLRNLSRQQGKTVTLKEVPDEELDRIAGLGFDWVWLLSVWHTSAASRAVSRSNPDWPKGFRRLDPGFYEKLLAVLSEDVVVVSRKWLEFEGGVISRLFWTQGRRWSAGRRSRHDDE